MDYTGNTVIRNQRLTQAQKNANGKQWYKDMCDALDHHGLDSFSFTSDSEHIDDYTRMKVNYDLFNDVVDLKSFNYVCKPFGESVGELPANLSNKDIVSTKIKVLLGMESSMPSDWKIYAINPEATTRKEQEKSSRIRQFVEAEIMQPIKIQIEKEARAKYKGKELTPEEEQQVEKEIQDQTKAQTPDEVKKYMLRDHQDPAEIQASQILEYLMVKQQISDKFNKAWKHMCLSGTECFTIPIINGEPKLHVVNALFLRRPNSSNVDFIEDEEWVTYEMRMTPTQIITQFGSELTSDEISRIYDYNQNPTQLRDVNFNFDGSGQDAITIRVLHTAFQSLMKVGFLTYFDPETGKPEMTIVNDTYKINKEQGDISILWEWVPEAHEVYKILSDIYVGAGPVKGQIKDLDNIWESKLPYYGASCDNMNSVITSPMDRMKGYQYMYNVILYRIELLMASDEGKIMAMNINSIPKSAGIDLKKFMYYMKANKIAFLNPNEEGNKGGDVTNMVKEINMSLVSEIKQYIDLADYIERKCGLSIGVTPQMEAQIAASEAVTNTKQNLTQASYIIKPYFDLHNQVKRNVLQALIDKAKYAYSENQPKSLSYAIDDMSLKMLQIDQELLSMSTLALYLGNAMKAQEVKQNLMNLTQAALQNQQADLLDVIKIMKSDSLSDIEEELTISIEKKREIDAANQQAQLASDEKLQAQAQEFKKEEMKHEERMIILKEEERRKTEIQKQAMFSMGLDPNKDEDDDGVPDVLEVAKFGVDADIKRAKLQQDSEKLSLEQDKFKHQVQNDKEKLKIEHKKLLKTTNNSK